MDLFRPVFLQSRLCTCVQIAALSILISLPAAGIMKFFVREVPYATHFVVFLWAFARSAFVFLVMPLVAALSRRGVYWDRHASHPYRHRLARHKGTPRLWGAWQISRNGSENDSIARPFVMGNRWHSLCRLAGASEGVNFTWP
jgi:hypothetical protein